MARISRQTSLIIAYWGSKTGFSSIRTGIVVDTNNSATTPCRFVTQPAVTVSLL